MHTRASFSIACDHVAEQVLQRYPTQPPNHPTTQPSNQRVNVETGLLYGSKKVARISLPFCITTFVQLHDRTFSSNRPIDERWFALRSLSLPFSSHDDQASRFHFSRHPFFSDILPTTKRYLPYCTLLCTMQSYLVSLLLGVEVLVRVGVGTIKPKFVW